MALTNREVAILGILLCCVPFQLWLTKLSSLSKEEKGMRIQGMLLENKIRIQALFSPSLWYIWIKDLYKSHFIKDYTRWYPDDDDPLGECPAVEVIKFRYPEEHFGKSVVPHEYMPSEVKWRVGQVIQHKKYNYIGVIIGWDKTCKAPDFWIKKMHGNNYHWKLQPNYAILVDVRNMPNPQTTYVPEENIEVIKQQVHHPDLVHYFDSFDGAQYLPQPWLKAIYPLD